MSTKDFHIKPPVMETSGQPHFRVVYTIDVNADNEKKAAELAWQMMRAEDALDPVVTVLNGQGNTIELDLCELLEFNKITSGFAIQRYRKDDSGKFRCKDQEFVAGDDVRFENLKGDPIEEPGHEYQPFNMTLVSTEEIIKRLGDVLIGIDVGGEQSRQFANEIKILSDLSEDICWSNNEQNSQRDLSSPGKMASVEYIVKEKCPESPHLDIKVKVLSEGGQIWIQPQGYGEKCTSDGDGFPIGIEIWQGRLRMIIFDDINREDPQVIYLKKARESCRIDSD